MQVRKDDNLGQNSSSECEKWSKLREILEIGLTGLTEGVYILVLPTVMTDGCSSFMDFQTPTKVPVKSFNAPVRYSGCVCAVLGCLSIQ